MTPNVEQYNCKSFLVLYMPLRQQICADQMYEKLKILTEGLLAKLHPSNLVNTIFY